MNICIVSCDDVVDVGEVEVEEALLESMLGG